MWLSKRKLVLLGAAALGGCGFKAVYGPNKAGYDLHKNVALDLPNSQLGYLMRRRFLRRLGAPQNPLYRLKVSVQKKKASTTFSEDSEVARIKVPATASFVFSHADGKIILQYQVSTVAGYANTGEPVAVRSVANDTNTRLAVVLADRILTRISALQDPGK